MTTAAAKVMSLPGRLLAPLTDEVHRRVHAWLSAKVEAKARAIATESTPSLEGLVREIVWLQHRVDELEAALVAQHDESRRVA